MNTLIKWFSLCLCFCALAFSSVDIKTGENLIKADKSNAFVGKATSSESSSRGVCDESFAVAGYGDLNGNGSLELCYTDGTGFFNFTWDGGCVAQTLTLSDGVEQDLSTYAFNAGFFYFGFENGLTEEVIITFDDGTAAVASATVACGTTCEDNGWVECFDGGCQVDEASCPVEGECAEGQVLDCVDSDCCPESWIGDGFADCEDQAYGCDLTCYDNDGGDCEAGATDGGTTGGTTGGTASCDDCELDWSAYGSECCDTAWDDFGIDCATLESTYGWDCAGCSCPGDNGGTTGGTTGGDDGGTGGECEEGFCPEGTYWDGFSCYDCSYCLDTADDSACGADTGLDCCGACGGSFDGGCCAADETQCWDGSCADSADDCPEQPEVTTPAICAEGLNFDPGTGAVPAVTVTWFVETVCGDGLCTGDETFENCPEDCNAPGECDDGFVPDCVDDDCCPESWIGDGFEDCEDQAYGCDLTCYDNDGGDCGAGGDDGGTTGGTTGGTASCEDCEFDWSAYGSECCDTAWDDFGIDCATLESTYGWDCAGCGCPGDGEAVCGDGNCTGDETYENCPEDCNAPGECSDGEVSDCDESGECWIETWIGDGFCDGTAQQYGADLCCYDNDGGDCTEAECAPGREVADAKSIKDVSKVKKGAPYKDLASASLRDGYYAPSNRLTDMTIFLDCEACLTGGPYSGSFVADPALGEFTVYGFDALTAVNVSAQACDGGACGDIVGPVTVVAGADDGAQECTEGGGGDPCDGTLAGDVTLDGEVNVLDIVQIVNHILESALLTDECAIGAADYTDDGEVNVLDIVQIVNIILDGRITGDATSAKLQNDNGQMTIDANGYIGGIQMTLSHGADFSIELTEDALVADFNTMGNTTKLVIVAPETDELFSTSGDYTIDEMIVANSASEVTVSMPSSIEIVGAYPNPFNPSTTVSVSVNDATNATIMAYDIAGRSVGVVFDGVLDAGMTSVTWNASSLPSGVYILKLSTPDGSASMQKVMLMK
jgi:hypothetical protein